jgi:hypothetical protein
MTNLEWSKIVNGFAATHGDRKYYVGSLGTDIFAGYTESGSNNVTHIKWGGIASLEEAMSIAQQHAN